MQDKPIPKSLHTVTVLVNMARLYMEARGHGPEVSVNTALDRLHLLHRPDPHNLRAAALKQLEAADG